MGSGCSWLAGDWPSKGGAFSTLLRRPGLRASNGGVLATQRKMLASTCLYSLYAYFTLDLDLTFVLESHLLFKCNGFEIQNANPTDSDVSWFCRIPVAG